MLDMQLILEQTRDINLLYVEDNDDLRESTVNVLKNFFNNIDIATDGLEGLTKYKEGLNSDIPYDLVITDINMPNMNGLKMAEEIIELEPRESIIMITAHNEIEFLHTAIKIGVDSFLVKPLKLEMLSTILFKVCRNINDKKFVMNHYNLMENKNIEMENEITTLKNLIKSGGITKENTFLTKSSHTLSDEEITELKDVKDEMQTHIVMLDQYIKDENKTREYLFKLSRVIDKSINIFNFQTFEDNICTKLRALSMQLSMEELPNIESRKELYKYIASMIISLNTYILANIQNDNDKIINSLDELTNNILNLLSKWEDAINKTLVT